MGSLVCYLAAEGRGGKVVGDELWRRRSSVVDEGDAPVILGTSGCAHELRGDAAVPKVWTKGPERA